MRLAYGFLCDYATAGAAGKPTAVGIFDTIMVGGDTPSLALPPCVLHGLAKTTGEPGRKHVFDFELHDEDGDVVRTFQAVGETGEGKDGIAGGIFLYVAVGGWELPGFGDFEFVLKAGGVRFGEIPLHVRKIDTALVPTA